ncbi:MAG: translesion error-prone DNA polymerase V autoproteolytic subunit [Spirochaetes bacterium]|nr:translesion error-prone DNA polymerase V autoproteolytic subunit [Spirochaetota bacterium]
MEALKEIRLAWDGSIESIRRAGGCVPARFPLFVARIPAGFPSPADDYVDKGLDLNEFLVRHPAATFFVRVSGDSMTGAGINSGDVLVVDRAESVRDRNIVIAALNGELTVKRFVREDGRVWLLSENQNYPSLEVTGEMDFEVWGVVVHVIRSFR